MTYEEGPPSPPPRAAIFRAMAERIDLNEGQGFGGAFVIVPPSGEPLDTLLLNNKENEAAFWSLLKTSAEIALAEIDERQRSQMKGWGYS